ncbi:MAG: hypothetical protein Q9220_002255 [cf. Caloplaca sp. 1 TL-2023]
MDPFMGHSPTFTDLLTPFDDPTLEVSDEEFRRMMGGFDIPLEVVMSREQQQVEEEEEEQAVIGAIDPALLELENQEVELSERAGAQTDLELETQEVESSIKERMSKVKKDEQGGPGVADSNVQPVEQEGLGITLMSPPDTTSISPPQDLPSVATNDAPAFSKRALKRLDFEKQDIAYGDDDRKKGEVKVQNGVLYVKERNEWTPAVYHHELRAERIAQAPPSLYTHAPRKGEDPLDVTSFWPPHKDFGFSTRDTRPPVLFNWILPKTFHPKPNHMTDNGRIVIDMDNHPVIDYPIPFALSSEIEAGRLELMSRSNHRQPSKADFRARMMPTIVKRGEKKPLMTANSIGMRRIRFRDIAGLPAAEVRQHSDSRKRALVQCIPPDIMIKILAYNDTRYWRDMTVREVAYIENRNRGSSLAKAGSWRISEKERKNREVLYNHSMRGFQLVNPTAYPYGEDMNDEKAVAVAREALGLDPLEPKPSYRATRRASMKKGSPATESSVEPKTGDGPYQNTRSSARRNAPVTPSDEGTQGTRKRQRDDESTEELDESPPAKRPYLSRKIRGGNVQSHPPSSKFRLILPAPAKDMTVDSRDPSRYLKFMPRTPRDRT